MELMQIIVLSLMQGLTEFLPISSSAHLILVPKITGWSDQGLVFDIAVHVGTLLAVMFYFRHDLIPLVSAWFRSILTRQLTADARLAWAIIIGTIPVGLAGLMFEGIIETELRSPMVIAASTIIFAGLLWWADVKGRGQLEEKQMTWKMVVMIGIMQAMALIPGASRSGTTMTAGLALGMTRKAAARFSFLLSIPVIVLAGGLQTIELISNPVAVDWGALLLSVAISAVSAFFCIHYFIKFLDKVGMMPFVIYRLILGVFLIWFFSGVSS
ncbi:MAG: undecaprenyl-diphosphate phosphatase [Methylococcales bacterium]|nr:undecaprenyl-diphosphate phosphatase [Methylococcales bacterium]